MTTLPIKNSYISSDGVAAGWVLTADGSGAVEWAPGGGSQPGVAIVRKFGPFAFDTPDIENGVLIGYTPAVGDILLDAWFGITEAFDGSTPKGDFGVFLSGATDGIWGYEFNTQALAPADSADSYGLPDMLAGGYSNAGNLAALSVGSTRTVPATFIAANPLLVVISQDGSKGGDPVGGSAGQCFLYLVTATPA